MTRLLWIQEAQLTLWNRASAMHFFVDKLLTNGVMTYSYIHYLRNLRPANLLRTERINLQHATAARAHDAPPHCRLTSHFWRTRANTHINFILLETIPDLHDMCYGMGLSVGLCSFTQLVSKAKKRCSKRALTRDHTVRWPLLSREPDRISAETLYRQKL